MTKRKGYNPAKNHGGGVGQADYTEHNKVHEKQKTKKEAVVQYQGEETEDAEESRSYAHIFVLALFGVMGLLYLIKMAMDK